MGEKLDDWPPAPSRSYLWGRSRRREPRPAAKPGAPAITRLRYDDALPVERAVRWVRFGIHPRRAARHAGLAPEAAKMLLVLAGRERLAMPGCRCRRCEAHITRYRFDRYGLCRLCMAQRDTDFDIDRVQICRSMLVAGAKPQEIAQELGLSLGYTRIYIAVARAVQR